MAFSKPFMVVISSLELRDIVEKKIECSMKFPHELNKSMDSENITYDVVSDFEKLMRFVRGSRL